MLVFGASLFLSCMKHLYLPNISVCVSFCPLSMSKVLCTFTILLALGVETNL